MSSFLPATPPQSPGTVLTLQQRRLRQILWAVMAAFGTAALMSFSKGGYTSVALELVALALLARGCGMASLLHPPRRRRATLLWWGMANLTVPLVLYGMLDNQEKRINRAIDDELQQFGQATTDAARLAAAQAGDWPVLRAEQAGLAYWAAASWGGWISLSKDDPDVVADLPLAVRLAQRAWAADPDWGQGSLTSLLGLALLTRKLDRLEYETFMLQ